MKDKTEEHCLELNWRTSTVAAYIHFDTNIEFSTQMGYTSDKLSIQKPLNIVEQK